MFEPVHTGTSFPTTVFARMQAMRLENYLFAETGKTRTLSATMKIHFSTAATLLLGIAGGWMQASQAAPALTESYEVIAKYAVGGIGGWDFLSVDEKRHRLYISRSDHVQIVDTTSGKVVGDIPGTAGVHGIAIAGDLGLGFTSNGRSDSVTVFDLDTFSVIDTVKVTGSNPDAILYEPYSKRILTFNGRSANVTVIDATTRRVVGTIAVSGKPEVAVADGRGQAFVNIEDKNSIAVIDMASLAVSKYWPLGSCDGPTGLAIDRKRNRLFSVCHNKKMIVVDGSSGNVIAELPIGAEVDGAEFDATLDLAFSSNGDGTMTIVKSGEPGQITVTGTVTTQKSAKTIALDAITHRIYLPAASFAPPPPSTLEKPRPRPSMIPDSFVILVLAPKNPQ
jgi:YVTN family beta-propeller protein